MRLPALASRHEFVLLCIAFACHAGAQDREKPILQTYPRHGVNLLALSPDEKLLAGASVVGDVYVWDLSVRKVLLRLQAGAPVFKLDFIADGAELLVGTANVTVTVDLETRQQRGWRLVAPRFEQGKLVASPPQSFYSIAFARQSPWQAIAHSPAGAPEVVAFHPPTKRSWRFRHFATGLVFGPHGRTLITNDLSRLQAWNMETGKRQFSWTKADRFLRHPSPVKFSPHGKFVAVIDNGTGGSTRDMLRILDVSDGTEVRSTPLGRMSGSCAWESDQSIIFVDGSGATFRWRLDQEQPTPLPLPAKFVSATIAVSPREGILFHPLMPGLVSGLDFFDVSSCELIERLRPAVEPNRGLFIDSADGAIWGRGPGGLYRWDLAGGAREPMVNHVGRVLGIHNGQVLSVWKDVQQFTLQDANGGRAEETIRCLPEGLRMHSSKLATTRDLRWLAVSSGDQILLCDVNARQMLAPLKRGENVGAVSHMRFSGKQDHLTVCDSDGNVELWDVESAKRLERLHDQSYVSAFGKRSALLLVLFDRSEQRRIVVHESAGAAVLENNRADRELYAGPVFKACLSADEQQIAIAGSLGIRVFDTKSLQETGAIATPTVGIGAMHFTDDKRRLIAEDPQGGVRMWDIASGSEAVHLVAVGEGDHVLLTPDGYYQATRGGLEALAHSRGRQALPCEQLDLQLNRPDLVLARVGAASEQELAVHKSIWQQRVRRDGHAPVPDVKRPTLDVQNRLPLKTSARHVVLRLSASDSDLPLDRLTVFVNNVPLPARSGRDIRDGASRNWTGTVDLELTPGVNRIEAVVRNAGGALSERYRHEVFCTAEPRAAATFLLGIGISRYRDERYNLAYAAKDVNDVADYLRGLMGQGLKGLTLQNEQATREAVIGARQFLADSSVDDTVIVYLAGHGLRSADARYFFATTDTDFSRPEETGVSFDQLQDLLDGIPARRRVLFMDTCYAGDIATNDVLISGKPGSTRGAVTARGWKPSSFDQRLPNRLRLEEVFVDLRRGTGAMVIAAAGGADFAIESAHYRNGIFTHAVLDSLRSRSADMDSDLTIYLSELRRRTSATVSQLTNGLQVPTCKRENFQFDVPLLVARPADRVHQVAEPGYDFVHGTYVSPDASRLAIELDEVLHVFDTADWKQAHTLSKPAQGKLAQVALRRNVVVAADRPTGLMRWSLPEGKLETLERSLAPEISIRPWQLDKEGKQLCVVNQPEYRQALAWNVTTSTDQARVFTTPAGTESGALAEDGRRLVLAAVDGQVTQLDMRTGQTRSLSVLESQDETASALLGSRWSRKCRFYACLQGTKKGAQLTVWNVESGEVQLRCQAEEDTLNVVRTPDGPLVFQPVALQRVSVRPLSTGTAGLTLPLEPGERVVISRDGNRLLVAAGANAGANADPQDARVWDLNTGREIAWIVLPEGTGGIVFSPAGERLWMADHHGRVHAWNL